MKLVVDTSILIDYLRGSPRWEHFLAKVEKDAVFYLPTIVIYELFSGKSTQNPLVAREVTNFLKNFQKIELTEKIAKLAGELYRDVNKTLQVPDYIVAASSLSIEGTIVTLNRKHFDQIPSLDLYPL